jgi:mono/diheme cytochrome c family protein
MLGQKLHAEEKPKESPSEEKITFDDHIQPIFRQKCASCHNPDRKSSGLDLTSYTNLMQGGSSGDVIDPGQPRRELSVSAGDA